MCMFCVIQKWSRRVATMLPWLVVPLIGLWGLTQLLPPPFRFEITSPKLACVFVLLATLFWYEVLMPKLSAWRGRRNARLRERKRFEALELLKMKKTATRKCRNCLTPYRDQNPGGGKFMCSYCGHISKRPVLDMPISPGLGISNSGIIKEFFGQGGKIVNGKAWSNNVLICNQEWLENGNWVVSGCFQVKSAYFGQIGMCLAEKSCSSTYFFPCSLLMSILRGIRWLWRKVFGISSFSEDSSSYADRRGMLAKRGENDGGGYESRGEKARRKAEEKRQARLEKELWEEEERKQREEVARLVEKGRKLQDEKIEAENRARGASSLRERDSRKEAERKRQERRKEKDNGSSKSNSDVEELEKKSGKENERKPESERKNESDRQESLKTGLDSAKAHNPKKGYEAKGNSTNNFSRGARYFDGMRGTFSSSSKAFTGSGFFGKVAPAAPASKQMKPICSVDYSLFSNSRYDLPLLEFMPGKTITNGDDKSNIRPVSSDIQHKTAPNSWQQLFTRSPVVPVPSHPNVISRPSSKPRMEVQSSQPPHSVSSPPLYDNPINLPSPFTLPLFSSRLVTDSSTRPVAKDPFFPSVTEMCSDLYPEEPELFEDPCYEPDPISLLGPVSESLDIFELDELGKSRPSTNVSQIESPLSRLRVADEMQNNGSHLPSSPKALNINMPTFPVADLKNVSNKGRWHFWNSSPLCPDGLILVGGHASWIASLSSLNDEEILNPSSQKTMASLFKKDGHGSSETLSPDKFSPFCSSFPCSKDQDPWRQAAFFPQLSGDESPIPITSHKKMVYGSPIRSAANHAFDRSTACYWSKNEGGVPDFEEGNGNPFVIKSSISGPYSPLDVQSLWSYE